MSFIAAAKRYLVFGLICQCLSSLGWSSSAQSAEPFLRTEDVIYGRKYGTALTMDVFQPAEVNGCGLLFLVNGGWLSSKSTPRMVTIRPDDYRIYLERGYTVFAVVTSSQPRFAIPELIEDVQRAVRFVRTNASRFGVRPDRLGLLGSSSGGHLALSVAVRAAPGNAESADPVERESSDVQAVACFFPPTDFLNYGGPGISGVGEGPMAPLQVAFGPRALTAEGRASLGRDISPIYQVTSKLPPTLLIHGDADDVVPLGQSESFVQRAQEAGAQRIKLIIRPGKGHGWGDFWKSTEDITAFADWFDTHLRGQGDDVKSKATAELRRQPGWLDDAELVDLTHPFDEQTIFWPTERGFTLEKGPAGMTPKGYYYAANRFASAEHCGTHLDAPIHFYKDRRTVDQIPLKQLIGEAVVIDVSDRCARDPDYEIGIADFRRWEEKHRRQLAGEIVLVRTGFGSRWPKRKEYLGTEETGPEGAAKLHFPGLAPEAAQWLVQQRSIKAIGIDTASIDRGQSKQFGSHIRLFEHNVPAFENLADLRRLPEEGFIVIALPMKIAGGTGAPLRIVAALPRARE